MKNLLEIIEKLKKGKEIFVLSNKEIITKCNYYALAKEIRNDKLFLIVETEEYYNDYDNEFFGGFGHYVTEKDIIYLNQIKNIFLTEEEKDEYLLAVKRRQKGYAVHISYERTIFDEFEEYTLLSREYVFFSKKEYEVNSRIMINGSCAIVKKVEKSTFGKLEKELNKKSKYKIKLKEI